MSAMQSTAATLDDTVSRHDRLHKLISVLFEPSILGTPFIFVVVYTRRHLFALDLQTVYLLLSFFGAVMPITYTIVLYKLGLISSLFYSRRRDRMYFYPLLIFSELNVFFLFSYVSSSRALMAAAFAALAVSTGLAALTFWHKISYHLAGLGGALSIAVALVGWPGFVLLPIMPLVAYSRVRLREHSWFEVTLGGVYGIVVAAAAFRWFSARGDWILAWLPHWRP